MEIESISLAKLLKLELPEFADRVMGIVEKYEPEVLKIEEGYNQLVAVKPEIEALVIRYGPHPITEKLDSLREKRTQYATAILFNVRGYVKGYMSGDEAAVILAKEAVNRFLFNLRRDNEYEINRRITQFFAEIEQSTALESAFDALGITDKLDELQSVHSTIQEEIGNRFNSISKRKKGKTQVFARTVRTALRWLFLQIKIAENFNKELDYEPLISELNELIVSFKGLINLRATYNSKNNEGIDDNETGDSDTTQDAPETTTYVEPAGEMMRLNHVGDVSMNGHNAPLLKNGEKAIATSATNNATASSVSNNV